MIVKILNFCHLNTLWACPGMPDHTHPENDNRLEAFMNLYIHAKNPNNSSTHCGDIENLLFQYYGHV